MENQITPESMGDELSRILANFPKLSHSEAEEHDRKLEEQLKADKAEERRRIADRLWRQSQIPTRHSQFEIPKDGPWRDAYDNLKSKVGTGFLYVIMGNRGTGKTQLATAMVQRTCIKYLRSCLYVKALDIFIALREAYRKDGDAESEVIRRFTKPSLLVIDAMEERGETAFEDRLLNHIIDKRYDECSDTLLITNQTAEAFAASAGPSIISRIHETGDKIVCDWESFRKKGMDKPAVNWTAEEPEEAYTLDSLQPDFILPRPSSFIPKGAA